MTARGEVVVIGGANMDIRAKAFGALLPHVSNPGTLTVTPGGVARNIAVCLAQLGVSVALASRIGQDNLGDQLLAETAAAGVDLTMTSRSATPTGSYIATLDAEGELAVAVSAMRIIDELLPAALAPHAARLSAARLVAADCNLPVATLRWLKTLTQRLVIEPVSVAKCAKLLGVGLDGLLAITPNRLQAEALSELVIRSPNDAMKVAQVLEARGVRYAAIAFGAEGVATSTTHVPAFPGPVSDVTGAGDAAAAGLILGLLEERDIGTALLYGQAASHAVLSGAPLTRARLLSLIRCRIESG